MKSIAMAALMAGHAHTSTAAYPYREAAVRWRAMALDVLDENERVKLQNAKLVRILHEKPREVDTKDPWIWPAASIGFVAGVVLVLSLEH